MDTIGIFSTMAQIAGIKKPEQFAQALSGGYIKSNLLLDAIGFMPNESPLELHP